MATSARTDRPRDRSPSQLLHNLQPFVDLAARGRVGEVVGDERRPNGAVELRGRGQRGALRAAAGEPAQDLLGTGDVELQRPCLIDHLAVLPGEQIPVDRSGSVPAPVRDRWRRRAAGAAWRSRCSSTGGGRWPSECVNAKPTTDAPWVSVVVGGDVGVDAGGVPDQHVHHGRRLGRRTSRSGRATRS